MRNRHPYLIPVAMRRGFTLVELLTVVGICALLLAMLMPALTRAREAGQRAQCLAVLHQVANAAALNENEHGGYLPLAGWEFDPIGGENDPAGLGDPRATRYAYYTEDGRKRPLPITLAFARYMAQGLRLGNRDDIEADLRRDEVRRFFRCPSQQEMLSGLSQKDVVSGWTGPVEFSSYVFNEAALGRREQIPDVSAPVAGHMVRIRRPADVMLACDGRPRNMTNDNWILVFNKTADTTLYDFQQLTMGDNAFGKQTLDFVRHRGLMNVLFLDGHGEAVAMSPDGLKSVGVSKGIYN